MPKTAVEAATLIGVAAATLAGSFYAMGTVAHLSYLNALGFDAHQFPPVGLELQVMGLAYTVLPALFVGVVALAYASLFALTDRFAGWLSRHPPPAKWRMPIGLLVVGGVVLIVVVLIFLGLVRLPQWTLTQWIVADIIGGTMVLALISFGQWILPVVVCCFIGALMLVSVTQYVNGKVMSSARHGQRKPETSMRPRSSSSPMATKSPRRALGLSAPNASAAFTTAQRRP